MSAKMNWDRVRKETQTRRSGSEWIGSDDLGATPGKEIKSSQQRSVVMRTHPLGRSRMPDCICGKLIGFKGSHKRKCPLSNSSHLPANSSLRRTSFSGSNNNVGKLPPTREFLSFLQTAIELARSFSEGDRQGALKLIRALLESIPDAPQGS